MPISPNILNHNNKFLFILYCMEKNFFIKYRNIIIGFIVAEIIGIVICNIIGVAGLKKLNFTVALDEKREYADVFFKVLLSKTKVFFVLVIIGASVFYKYLPVIISVVFGFSYGVIACILSMFQGIWYFAVIFFAVIGHMVIYAYAVYILNDRKKKEFRYIAAYIIMVAGVALESVNYSVILYEILGK